MEIWKKNINILMLAIVHKGIAIPIFWILLNKKGNSNTRERIALIKRFMTIFGKDAIESLVADREFVGGIWFKWLDRQKVPFSIRIKRNFKVRNKNQQTVQVGTLFHDLKQGDSVKLSRKISLFGVNCYLTALGLGNEKLLLIASNDRNQNVLERYAKRWEIETLFSCLKGRGFNLEDTHLTDMRKMKKLLVIHAITFCFMHKIGEFLNEKKPIKIKNHGRKSKSIFRLGLDYFIDALKQMILSQESSKINLALTLLGNRNQQVMT